MNMYGIDRFEGHTATILHHPNHEDMDQTIGATVASGDVFLEKVTSHPFPCLSLFSLNIVYIIAGTGWRTHENLL